MPAGPVGPGEFERLMQPFEPFEPNPLVAVGVSGGADSTALTLLALDWVRVRGGRLIAVTVDHGLRAGSAAEADEVGRRLGARGVDHSVLRWTDGGAGPGLQARARAARLDLLTGFCAAHGVFHLLLAHAEEDQAETVLMRLAKGSGVDGLAGIPAVSERPQLRLLRPLLPLAKARLEATCTTHGMAWLRDPTNADPRFARGRLRGAAAVLAGEGLTPARAAETARRCAAVRAWVERTVAGLLARSVAIHPEGFAEIDSGTLAAAPAEAVAAALAAVVRTIGGRPYSPRRSRLMRLAAAVAAGDLAGGRTLGGCRLVPGRRLLVCRESAAAEERLSVVPGQSVAWDGRFRVTVPRLPDGPDAGLEIRRLGRVPAPRPAPGRRPGPPAAVRSSLPGLWHHDMLVATPRFATGVAAAGGAPAQMDCTFEPVFPLTTAGFSVACADGGII